ncbi:hypothetical protein J5226_01120 [Lysobacter sp. K5869]|uniref:hypothetical protein n=1 Tax=Lysobacter sp. K5869 TaxID=2820808 RepID=UPI001C062737|nr:hypothetical protein [Lysobacter sp. K5869]QWP77037.1 hypothetical protein J5226_01120 [Lysobacter sp. K5869]
MSLHFRHRAALACAAALALAGFAAQAQTTAPEGALDRGFGVDGVFLDDSFDYAKPTALTVQRDGKILMSAMAGGGPPNSNCRVWRLLRDGAPDPDFGAGAPVWIGDPRGFVACQTLAVRADGKIVVTGYGTGSFTAVRLRPDGTPDPGFGDGGTVRADFAELGHAQSHAWDAALQDDGKLVMVGDAVDYRTTPARTRFAILRLGEDGRLDPGFGDRGRVLTDFQGVSSSYNASALSVAIQGDGRIVVVGVLRGVGAATALARYLPDGRPDPSFGEGGRYASYSEALRPGGNMIAVQADGGLLVRSGTSDHQYQTVVRHFADGRIDPSFRLQRDMYIIDALKQQADGRILVVGSSDHTGPRRPELIRLNHDGTRDAGFVREDFGFVDGADFYQGVALQADGSIVLMAESLRRNGGGRGTLGAARLRAKTYCIADAFDPRRYLGFSRDGWFAAAGRDRDGAAVGAIGRGRVSDVAAARLHLLRVRGAGGVDVDAAVFDAEAGLGWGLGRVRASAPGDARFAILDPRLDDSACGAGDAR